jgi:hypothetical protein
MAGSITNGLNHHYSVLSRRQAIPPLTGYQPLDIMDSGVGVRRNCPSGKMTPTEELPGCEHDG